MKTREQQLLVVLADECAKLGIRVAEALEFGLAEPSVQLVFTRRLPLKDDFTVIPFP